MSKERLGGVFAFFFAIAGLLMLAKIAAQYNVYGGMASDKMTKTQAEAKTEKAIIEACLKDEKVTLQSIEFECKRKDAGEDND